MISDRRRDANRRNAKKSTGPRSLSGKERARHNALRHGLAILTPVDAPMSPEVERITDMVCQEDMDPAEREQARFFAEYQAWLLRIRLQRIKLYARLQSAIDEGIHARRRQAARDEPERLEGQEASVPRDPTNRGVVSALVQLTRLERYQQQALSRRRKALLALCGLRTTRAWNS